MSLRPQQLIPPVPDDTARVARTAFRRGNPYVLVRDQLGAVFADDDFADLYPALGQPAYPPGQLALVTLMQFREGLSDRQAAEAARARIDWKYLLGLDLSDPGFNFSILSEFRGRLLAGGAEARLLERLLEACQAHDLLRAGGRQRTDSTHVLAAVRALNQLELVAETLRAALNSCAAAHPDWLQALAAPEWHERYGRRIENARPPRAETQRQALLRQVGEDGRRLMQALDHPEAPADLQLLPAVRALRAVWAQQFAPTAENSGSPSPDPGAPSSTSAPTPPKQARRRGRSKASKADRLVSPYDTDARFRSRKGRDWSGYMVHFTETCDAHRPRLITHADTTPANVHDMVRLAPIHAALAGKGLLPREHLVDAGYVSAGHLVQAAKQHGIALVGPGRKDVSWQRRTPGAFQAGDFTVTWDERRVRCPEGKESVRWGEFENAARGRYVKVRFKAEECLTCRSRARCTRSTGAEKGRQLLLQSRDKQEALAAARVRQGTDAGRRLYAMRQGIEATFSQGVRAFGLRRARYRGLAKTRLQHVVTAAALNLDRVAAWMRGRPVAPTRTSRFTALAA